MIVCVSIFRNMLRKKTSRLLPIVAVLLTVSSCAITQQVESTDLKCPSSPKCVSSAERDTSQYIESFSFDDEPNQAMARLKLALLSEDNVTITNEQPNMLSAEARSALFGFVDDVKFVLLPEQGIIEVRSSARTGYSDLGVNRRRVERIREVFNDGER
jgi:uncharacterized protein (DUF1499 family)